VLDWVRTDHKFLNNDGTSALAYHRLHFIYFDVFLLKRPGSEDDYSEQDLTEAKAIGLSLSDQQREALFKNVLLGLPGSSENFTAEKLLELIAGFQEIS